jgi:FtsP/CotA-like multicopper oxidase with cupredoxin domain
MSRSLSSRVVPSLALVLLVGAGGAAFAQTPTCPSTPPSGQELKNPPELTATHHLLNTKFSVEEKKQCVPVYNGATKTWSMSTQTLRTYVYIDPKTGKERWGYPGPTLRIHKQSDAKTTDGDRLKILLVNALKPDTTAGGKCDNACPAGAPACPTDSKQLPDPNTCNPNVSLCCCWVNLNQHWPDCFHGDNTTNLHFHGTHVSPQAPQDYVLLELRPKLPAGAKAPADAHPAHERGEVVYGQYQYNVDPPPPTQAEGTHWYHAHKHGSVSLQVANGMPGALIIEGPFDKWLRNYYSDHLEEKILVLQQIQAVTNLYTPSGAPNYLVNGQVSPVVHMRAGEVQRWRFLNATMQVAAQVSINFPTGVAVKQIAADGVQFAPENYASQPLFSPNNPSAYNISPGNRADFLVQAPATAGTYRITQHVFGRPGERSREQIRLRDRAFVKLEALRDKTGKLKALAADENAEPALLTLIVEAPKPQARKLALATGFPTVGEWPKMPWYLENLQPKPDAPVHDLDFQMVQGQDRTKAGGPGNPATIFTINDVQYCDKCVNITTKLDDVDRWVVKNSSALAHPYHIHTNPFQLVEQGTILKNQNGKDEYVPFIKYDTPPWLDTIALPVQNASWDVKAGPIFNQQEAEQRCPTVCLNDHGGMWNKQWTTIVPGKQSVCGCSYTGDGYVRLHQRYLEFTGEYVFHCHFLGHEDRGMMFGVQTVCKDKPDSFGKAKPYGQPECVPGNLIPAATQCKPSTDECLPASATAAHGHE